MTLHKLERQLVCWIVVPRTLWRLRLTLLLTRLLTRLLVHELATLRIQSHLIGHVRPKIGWRARSSGRATHHGTLSWEVALGTLLRQSKGFKGLLHALLGRPWRRRTVGLLLLLLSLLRHLIGWGAEQHRKLLTLLDTLLGSI